MSRRWVVVLCAALVVASACTGGDDAGPAPTTEPTVPTSLVDRSGIALARVDGTTTSTIVERGTAVLAGSVQGPAGLLVGATVRIERLVGGREVRTDVVTGPDGRFRLADVPGGRYRLRAFLAPWYAQVRAEVRFLEDGEEHTFDLAVEEHAGLVVRADVAPEPPLVGHDVNLVASVASRSVGADGVVRSIPVAGATVELVGLGRWELRDDSTAGSSTTSTPAFGATTSTTRRSLSPTARTDAAGRVRYELRCEAAGSPGLALRIPVTIGAAPGATTTTLEPRLGSETIALDLPACIDPGTATTTTTAGATATTAP